jgi:hypothetical protein
VNGGGQGGANARTQRTAPRLHSSDDGLFLATSALRRLEEDVRHFGDFCSLDLRAEDRRRAANIRCRSIRKSGLVRIPDSSWTLWHVRKVPTPDIISRGRAALSNVRHCLNKYALNAPQIVSLQYELISVPLTNMVPEHLPSDGRLEL